MSHVVVTNAAASSFRIRTTPTKYLTEVRDEACQKFGVSKDQFTLKYVGDGGSLDAAADRTQGTTISPSLFHSKYGSQTYRRVHG